MNAATAHELGNANLARQMRPAASEAFKLQLSWCTVYRYGDVPHGAFKCLDSFTYITDTIPMKEGW